MKCKISKLNCLVIPNLLLSRYDVNCQSSFRAPKIQLINGKRWLLLSWLLWSRRPFTDWPIALGRSNFSSYSSPGLFRVGSKVIARNGINSKAFVPLLSPLAATCSSTTAASGPPTVLLINGPCRGNRENRWGGGDTGNSWEEMRVRAEEEACTTKPTWLRPPTLLSEFPVESRLLA